MIKYVGVNDRKTKLFEGQFVIPEGISYNSYVIFDEKICVMDSVDKIMVNEWLDNLKKELNGKTPDYLVISHMEPDHSSSLSDFVKAYPNVTLVGNAKTFVMLNQFFPGFEFKNTLVVKEGDILNLGKSNLKFITAPMVHWPEVMVSYLDTEKVLFSADAFGKFGSLDFDDPEGWACEARRYYFGIVGKYGTPVQTLLKKVSTLDIKAIYPLHGPVLDGDLSEYLSLYDTWSKYEPEKQGTVIIYTSVYGNTKEAAEELGKLVKDSEVMDLIDEDIYECVESAFEYRNVVLATTTYNGTIFPRMFDFINMLKERGFQNRNIAVIENGSWAPMARKVIVDMFEGSKNINILDEKVTIKSALTKENMEEIKVLADKLNNI